MTEELTGCYSCAQGLYAECLDPKEAEDGLIIPCAVHLVGNVGAGVARSRGEVLSPEEITDPLSTGRKRAAAQAPILSGMWCEWSGLRQAGGGVIPVVGCVDNQISDKKGGDPEHGYLQGDRHHGPDKAVINNTPGQNLHRICKLCHNRWHTLNDPYYAEERPNAAKPWNPSSTYYAHDANTEATIDEQEAVEAWWQQKKAERGPYPVTPTGLRKFEP